MRPSRAMITGELSWAWIAIAYAWSGSGLWPFTESYLHVTLDRNNMNELWSLLIGVPALALMFCSAREWLAHCMQRVTGRQWTMIQLDHSVRMRGWLCFALVFSWLYVIYVMLLTTGKTSTLTMVATGGVFFMFMFWIENRRVQRDIKKHTSAGFIVRT